jgi:hypothetical protein
MIHIVVFVIRIHLPSQKAKMTDLKDYFKITLLYKPRLAEVVGDSLGESKLANEFTGSFGKKVLEKIDPQLEMKKNPNLRYEDTTAALPLVVPVGAKIALMKYNKENGMMGAVIIVKENRLKKTMNGNNHSFNEYDDDDTWQEKSIAGMSNGKKKYRWGFSLFDMRENPLKPPTRRKRVRTGVVKQKSK